MVADYHCTISSMFLKRFKITKYLHNLGVRLCPQIMWLVTSIASTTVAAGPATTASTATAKVLFTACASAATTKGEVKRNTSSAHSRSEHVHATYNATSLCQSKCVYIKS